MPKPPSITNINELHYSPGEWDALPSENGVRIWSHDKKFHRKDGPALEYPNGIKVWYVDGVWCCTEDRNMTMEADNTTGDRLFYLNWLIYQKELIEDRYEKEN